MGAFLQVNAGSVVGVNGRAAKKFCRKLMKQDLLQLCGERMPTGWMCAGPGWAPCADDVVRGMGREYAERIFVENPREDCDCAANKRMTEKRSWRNKR